MDEFAAREMSASLSGTRVGSWFVGDFLGCGRSAFVCEAQCRDRRAAIKIYDPELVRKFGGDTQLGRIDRQLALVGKEHRNVVHILDGGHCRESGHYYIVMELLRASTLGDAIPTLPRERIRPVLGNIIAGAHFLDDLSIVHRDIKPSNIALTEDRGAVLLDLGVIRPHSLAEITDASGRRCFLGTLRYSSPEYLIREESTDLDGSRALTFYQLGAVLHDMIMRRPLFQEFSDPVGRLVLAVMQRRPDISAPDVPSDLVLLARNALVKDPVDRLSLVNWSLFLNASRAQEDPIQAIRSRIAARQTASAHSSVAAREAEEKRRAAAVFLLTSAEELMAMIRKTSLDDRLFPRLILRLNDTGDPTERLIRVHLPPSREHSLTVPLTIWLRVELRNSEDRLGRISAAAALAAPSDTAPANLDLLHSGVFEPAALEDLVRNLLYSVLDRALARCDEAPPADGPMWLPCLPELGHA